MTIFRGEKGICKGCGEEKWIVNKARYMDKRCNEKAIKLAKKNRKTVRPKVVVEVKTKKSEIGIFEAIWLTRPHYSEISGIPLPQFDVWSFAHILSKGAFPKFKYSPDNIMLMTRDEHIKYDCVGGIEELAKTHEGWRKLLEKKIKLKRKYHE